ncbi:hypothetical protein [Methylobacterium sp. CM6257]
MGDAPAMSCRHQPDATPSGDYEEAPSGCRRWRRWPSERPRPANDNGTYRAGWVLGVVASTAVGLLGVLGALITLAS